ncbi:uncharacterized protein CXQ87_000349 [Candidozyma duobushaemuli]|uniref:Uncharacterized protein n=2 Tax=Candidozyma TaxID=3303203 RepID=A0ABX8HZK0_9ASCO|nr:uncharacterized protein CXQ87_000349 [[Candida] duobushaemulonis]PVH17463.1 hypothetical protein CXQ87_000349 [[Candida] duobushaemulonis]QWU86102.1 hypothetical protein CA3LBN_000320 [[Candida] haemuloni]
MLGVRSITGVRLQPAVSLLARTSLKSAVATRSYAKNPDITKMPLNVFGCLADYYVPPRFLDCPITSWPRLVARRMTAFAFNTIGVVRYKKDTNLKLHFNDWKERTIENYVKTNKVFAKACSARKDLRHKYIHEQLADVAGKHVVDALCSRASSFPSGAKLTWKLVKVVENPKVVSFNPLPNHDDITVFIQLVTKVKTKQQMTVETSEGDVQTTERLVTDYLVSTIDPFSEEQLLVGSIFESDHIRKVQPEFNPEDLEQATAFQNRAADLYREPPKALKSA